MRSLPVEDNAFLLFLLYACKKHSLFLRPNINYFQAFTWVNFVRLCSSKFHRSKLYRKKLHGMWKPKKWGLMIDH